MSEKEEKIVFEEDDVIINITNDEKVHYEIYTTTRNKYSYVELYGLPSDLKMTSEDALKLLTQLAGAIKAARTISKYKITIEIE